MGEIKFLFEKKFINDQILVYGKQKDVPEKEIKLKEKTPFTLSYLQKVVIYAKSGGDRINSSLHFFMSPYPSPNDKKKHKLYVTLDRNKQEWIIQNKSSSRKGTPSNVNVNVGDDDQGA